MAYNPYNAVNRIYNLKGQWEYGNNSGDDNLKNEAAAKAKTYYQELIDNGYKDISDKLTAADYSQAKGIRDGIMTTGKSKTRDYFYSLGKSKGLSSADVDKLIEWNGETGEVSFGGKKIGRPDIVVDGTSYWSDTGVLDNAFNDYIQRSGTTNNSVLNKGNELWGMQTKDHNDLNGMYKKEYEDLKNTNPFTTAEAKSILGKYDLAGLQGRDNAAARGAGSNGGNIDSFAAANAMRQQAALINQGQQVVLDSYNQKLTHAKSLLDSLGVQQRDNYASMRETIGQQQAEEQRLFENEMAKAELIGFIPDEWAVSDNPYMNDDGTLKETAKNVDFSEVMNKALETGNTEAYNAAATARYYKIMSDYGKYGQYDDGNYTAPGRTPIESSRQFNKTADMTEKQLNTDIMKTMSEVMGKVPDEWEASQNPFIGDDGRIKAEYKNVDWMDVMTKAKAAGNEQMYKQALMAYPYWIMEDYGARGQYYNGTGVLPSGNVKTESARQSDEKIAAGDRALQAQVETADKDRDAEVSMHDKEINLEYAKMADSKADSSSSGSSSSKGSSSSSSKGSSSKSTTATTNPSANEINSTLNSLGFQTSTSSSSDYKTSDNLSSDTIKRVAGNINSKFGNTQNGTKYQILTKNSDGTYKVKDGAHQIVVLEVLNNSTLSTSQKNHLLFNIFKIPEDIVNSVANDGQYK